MKWKDLAVGKYVTLNRWLNDYYEAYTEILEIVSVPDTKEEGKVGCRQVTNYASVMVKDKYVNDKIIYINYIHLLEVKYNPYDCRNWAVGDILVTTKYLVKFMGERLASHAPYIVNKIDKSDSFLRIHIHSCDGVINYGYVASPLYFKKDNSFSVWRGFFASQYYKGNITFNDDGELVKPFFVVKGSPIYNQIMKEAIECGIIKG